LNLLRKSIDGSIWNFLDILINRGTLFISTIVLARLLGPNEFGLIGMISLFFSIGSSFVDSGLSVSLIRTPNTSTLDYSTIFYLNILFALVAYLIIFISAPYISVFYNQEKLTSLIRIYCIGIIISAFRIVPQTKLTKQMNFKKIAILNVPGNLIGFLISLTMALNDYKVWSIIGLYLSTQLITTILFCLQYKWDKKIMFSFSVMKSHLDFGYKLMLAAQLNAIFDNLYNLLIGKYFSVTSLGFYERAFSISNYPVTLLSGIITKVSLPLFSEIKDDKQRISLMFKKVMGVSFFVAAPLMIGLIVLANPLFEILLGKQWAGAVPFFQILCISYMFYPVHVLNVTILSVYGRSDLFLKIEIIKKVSIILFSFLGLYFGVLGIIWSSVIASLLALFINSFYTGSIIKYTFSEQIVDLLPIIVMSSFMAFFMLGANVWLNKLPPFFLIIISSLLGFGFLIYFSNLFKLKSFMLLKSVIKTNYL